MAGNTSHQMLHRMVPLICQALTTSPSDETVWLESLRLLSSPKLRSAMASTSSIWLPLLLKALDVSRPRTVTLAALKLLAEVSETLEPMKSCLLKPLRALGREKEASGMEELTTAYSRLGLVVWEDEKEQRMRPSAVSTFSRLGIFNCSSNRAARDRQLLLP